ncbi:MAG TPA: polyhydroxyalkanoate synthesis regulator DNA-binding domain-containing protein [Vulgatibacter sp.]
MAENEIAGDGGADGRAAKVIKRYSNRKLYDTVESRYVTLDEIAEMVKAGAEVQIIDNRTKDDLTSITLAQIVFEEEKKTSRLPRALFREMIRNGGGKLSSIAGEVNTRVAAIRAEAEQTMARVLKRDGDGSAKDFVRSSRHAFEEWQRHLDQRLHRAVETVVGLPSLHREVQALRDKLAELEKKLEDHPE